jgi:prepilin-type N-terminal cleavage/methylation domain-containing protein
VESVPNRRAAGEDGFTLAELLTAIVVIGIGIFGTMQVFLGSLHATSATTARSRAVGIAARETELLQVTPWPALGFDPAAAPADPPEGRTVTVDPAAAAVLPSGPDQIVAGVTYHVARGVVWVAVGDNAEAEKRILVTITWHDETGDHLVRQDGLVSPGPPDAGVPGAVTPVPPPAFSGSPDPAFPDSRAGLTWSGGSAVTWEIEHALDAAFDGPVVDTVSLPAITSRFVKPGLSPGTTYWFRIRGRSGVDVSAWSSPISVTTTGLLTGSCRVGAMHVSPSPAAVDLSGGRLAAPVIVEIEAQGLCGGLSVQVQPDAATDVTRPMTVVGVSGVWRALLEADLAPTRWASGPHQVVVLDGAGATLASGVIVTCSGSGACPA